MADPHDFMPGGASYVPPQETWDPSVNNGQGGNVYTPQGSAAYIAANPQNYQGYTGAVNHVQNTPISANAYVPNTNPYMDQTGPTGFNPQAFEEAQQREMLTGGGMTNPYSDAYNQQESAWANALRMVPGTRPDIGVLAGTGDWYDINKKKRLYEKDFADWQIDPVTRQFGRVAAYNWNNPQFSSLAEAYGKGLGISGRGYNYGAKTPEMQELENRFLAGDMRAGQELAALRARGITARPKSDFKKWADRIYPALLMTIATAGMGAGIGAAAGAGAGAAGGAGAGAATGGFTGAAISPAIAAGATAPAWLAPALSAGWGALQAGGLSRWRDPMSVGLGAAGGFAGGYAGGAIGSGLNPIAGGMIRGGLGAFGQSAGQGIGSGNFNAGDILRNTAIGTVGGGVGGALTSMNPYAPEPGMAPTTSQRLFGGIFPSVGSGAATTALGAYWPSEAQRQAEEQRRRAIAQRSLRNDR